MKVVIDTVECCGHGRCEEVAPDLFEVRDDGLAHLLVERPGDSQQAELNEAVRTCPARAIRLEA